MFEYAGSESLQQLSSVLAIVAGVVIGALLLAALVETVRYFTSPDGEERARRDLFASLKRLALFGVGVSLLAMPNAATKVFDAFASGSAIEGELKANAAKATDARTALTPTNSKWAASIVAWTAGSIPESTGPLAGTAAAREAALRSQLTAALEDPNNAVGADVVGAAQAILASEAYAEHGSGLTNAELREDAALASELEQLGVANLDDPGLVSSAWLGSASALQELSSSLGVFDFSDGDKTYLDYAGWFSGRY